MLYTYGDFNPRPPWGGRRNRNVGNHTNRRFQSTPSVGRATKLKQGKRINVVISIHALRGEGDNHANVALRQASYFNPRPPWGGRRYTVFDIKTALALISIHALRGEGDAARAETFERLIDISIHALRGEGDCKNIQICNAMLVHSAYKTIYFCDSCAFYLT